MSTPQTTFAGNRHPITKLSMKKQPDHIPLDSLTITSDPLPASRSLPNLKYEAIFKKLKHGQRVKCEPQHTGRLASALRKHMERHGIKGSIKTVQRYPSDQMGRVWMMAETGHEGEVTCSMPEGVYRPHHEHLPRAIEGKSTKRKAAP